VALQQDLLKISPDLDMAQMLIDEIKNFRLEVTSTGTIQKLRVDANADLLLSVAISVYVAQRYGGRQIPIENLLANETGTPEILDDDARKMPTIWDSQDNVTNQPVRGLKYKWYQPNKTPSGGSNLPGLM
jgi:hypothetical protein